MHDVFKCPKITIVIFLICGGTVTFARTILDAIAYEESPHVHDGEACSYAVRYKLFIVSRCSQCELLQELDIAIAERRPAEALPLLKRTERTLLPGQKSGLYSLQENSGKFHSHFRLTGMERFPQHARTANVVFLLAYLFYVLLLALKLVIIIYH